MTTDDEMVKTLWGLLERYHRAYIASGNAVNWEAPGFFRHDDPLAQADRAYREYLDAPRGPFCICGHPESDHLNWEDVGEADSDFCWEYRPALADSGR